MSFFLAQPLVLPFHETSTSIQISPVISLLEVAIHFNFPFRAIFESQQALWVRVALEAEDEIGGDLLGREPLFEGGILFLGIS